MGRKQDRLAAKQATEQGTVFVHEVIALAQAAIKPATEEAAQVAPCNACTATPVAVKVAVVTQAAQEAKEAEEAKRAEDAKRAEEAKEAEERKTQNILVILNAIRVTAEEAEEAKQAGYSNVLAELKERLPSADEITKYLISIDKTWPLNDACTAPLGINKAKEFHDNAKSIAAFSVWRANYTRGFEVLPKSLVKAYREAERLTKDDTFAPEHGLIKRAVQAADSQDAEEAAETLKQAIESAKMRHGERTEEKQAEQAEQAEAAQAATISAITNLTTASIARVYDSILQLAKNPALQATESALILTAGEKLYARMKEAEKAEAAQMAAKQAEEAKEAERLNGLAEEAAQVAHNCHDGQQVTDMEMGAHNVSR